MTKYRKDIETEAEMGEMPSMANETMEEGLPIPGNTASTGDFSHLDEIIASLSEEEKQYLHRKLMTELGGPRMMEESEEI